MNGNFALQSLMAIASLAAVLLLIASVARVARRLPVFGRVSSATGPLRLIGALALDRTHRMHLLEVEGQHVLILTGAGGYSVTMLQRAGP